MTAPGALAEQTVFTVKAHSQAAASGAVELWVSAVVWFGYESVRQRGSGGVINLLLNRHTNET